MSDAADGVLVVDKDRGPTSHDVVAVARRALATSRVGHTGTLDPMATGVLVLVTGRATRLARFMTLDVKEYVAEVTFGRATTTYDAEGTTTAETGTWPGREALAARLDVMRGAQLQTPPAYSAKKVGGEIAHRAARRDAPLDLPPVAVVVHELTLDGFADGVATLSMRVSSGFYVRALAHDLGVALGTAAHLSGLRRTRAGAFDLTQAVSWATVASAPRGGMVPALLPLDHMLPDLPSAVLTPDAARRVRQGQSVQALVTGGSVTTRLTGPIRLLDHDAHLVGIAEPAPGPVDAADSQGRLLHPTVVLG